MNRRNILLRVAYDGTAYAGWQIQPQVPTVQGRVHAALVDLFRTDDFELFGSSRTDAGVHALDQCVTFRPPADPPIPVFAVKRSLLSTLPQDIRVQSVEEVPPGFHARHDNVGKIYTYLLHLGPVVSPYLGRYFWSLRYELNPNLMETAARQLIGEHDFSSFTVELGKQEVTTTYRTLTAILIREHGSVLAITIIGSSFLYKMVRRIVGFLVDVGRGRRRADDATTLLHGARVEDFPFETAPAAGLFLERVLFDECLTQAAPGPLPFLQLIDLC